MAGFAPKNQGGVSSSPYTTPAKSKYTYPGSSGPVGGSIGQKAVPTLQPASVDAVNTGDWEYDYTSGQLVRTGAGAGQQAADYAKAALAGLDTGYGGNSATATGYTPYMGSPAQVSMPSVGGGGDGRATTQPTERLAIPDTSAAQSAEFARAKDLAGLTARGALTGLAGAMAGRGTVGSGVEGRGQQAVINAGQQQLGEVGRQQAITGAELAQKQAETAYQGGITQRGQDISAQGDAATRALQESLAQYQGGITQRGQDIGQQQFGANLNLSQQELEIKRRQAQQQDMLAALQGVRY
jgi:hypothetical protein